MAVIRVDHTGTASDGTTWAAAYTTLVAALAVAVNGDVVWISSTHAGTYATSQNINAVSGASVAIKCVTKSGASGSSGLATGATETLTVNGTGFTIQSTNSQHLFIYGVEFIAPTGSSAANSITIGSISGASTSIEARSCKFSTQGTSTGVLIVVGVAAVSTNYMPKIRLCDCTFKPRNAAGTTNPAIGINQGDIDIHNPTIVQSAAKPLILFGSTVSAAGRRVVITGDISGYDASGGTIFKVDNYSGGFVEFRDCKISGTPTFIGGTFANNTFEVYAINVDSGDTKTVFEYRNRLGTITESESIYANDGETIKGVNVSWQVVTTSLCTEAEPFCIPLLRKYHGATSAITVDAEFVHDSATDLTDRNIWMTTSYMNSASFPTQARISNQNADPFEGTAVDHTNTSITWTGTGGFGNVNKQRLRNSLTPAEVGEITSQICLGIASKTIYLDPKQRIA